MLLAELGGERGRGPTMLASAPARELEEGLREAGFERVAARGRLCWLGLPGTVEALGELPRVLAAVPAASLAIVHLPARLWPLALEEPGLRPRAGLLRADLPSDRPLAALAVAELRERRLAARVAPRPLGRVASRRAMAGLETGGAAARRVRRLARGLVGRTGAHAADRGQALLMVLGAAFAILFAASLLAALGGALTGTARAQRAADLVALSGARSMRDDFPRLFTPPRLPGGAPNPRHLDGASTWHGPSAAAREAARPKRRRSRPAAIAFPDAGSFAPLRVRAEVTASVDRAAFRGSAGGRPDARPPAAPSGSRRAPRPWRRPPPASARRAARRSRPAAATRARSPTARARAMRPDVARGLRPAGRGGAPGGVSLVINSAYRSDAEQARLFAAAPDPRWVAPPGHVAAPLRDRARPRARRPPTRGWPRTPARFGFLQRYAWEPWHFGFTPGPAPCSAAGDAVAASAGSGRRRRRRGPPAFRPSSRRASATPIARRRERWNVSAALLAAQLMAESNFNPFAVSPGRRAGHRPVHARHRRAPTASTTRSTPRPRSTPRRT